MNNRGYRHLFHAAGALVLASLAGLWAWNTLSELFSLPQAQYRHVLAAFCLLAILKRALSPRRHLAGVDGESPYH